MRIPSQFNTHANSADYLMKVNGLSVGFNMPNALTGDQLHSLPPYKPRKAFLVDEYPACPESWMRSSGRIKSYFVPIEEGKGLWLDFNDCWNSASHVAIVVSVQGVNAVTGLPCHDPQLEQYRDECPKHKKAFGPDRLCTDCGFKWPKQNYIPSSSTPHGHLWLDGFRAEDGQVRQYVFTAQEARGVAAAIIGKDRVYALGISFFLAKQPKPPQTTTMQSRGWHSVQEDGGLKGVMLCCDSGGSADMMSYSAPSASLGGDSLMRSLMDSPKKSYGSQVGSKGITSHLGSTTKARSAGRLMSAPAPVAVKHLEVAAGARIDQTVADDTCDLDFYQKEPDGLIVINYCSEEEALRIIEAGKVDVQGSPEGFLTGIPVGNL
jgi:hypothetical protein